MKIAPLTLLAVMACGTTAPVDEPETDLPDTDVRGVWNPRLPPAGTAIAPLRGQVHQRAVFHLHSPYSHDACDGAGWVDGALDTQCRDDLRAALCTLRFDAAFLTDHPDYGDAQPFEDLFHGQPGDTLVTGEDGEIVANEITCDDGHVVRWRAGFEDDLMPVGMRRHVHDDPEVRHALMNGSDAASFEAMHDAGATVMVAHTEGRALEALEDLQDLGLHAVEAFNVHAMFSPGIRTEDLGLDGIGWASDIGPFLASDTTAEPDLLFLGVHQQQDPSIAKWDALLQRGPMMATAGSDAHQNVLPALLADGERVDSYRRTLRWFSTILVTEDRSLAALDAAVAARRAFVAFEILGTPTGFDVHVADGDTVHEMGSDAPQGDLVVTCPTLASGSPRGDDDPEITVKVFKDGALWQEGCGTWPTTPGVYRVRVDMTPHHLAPFLGSEPAPYLKPYPWLYSGAVRVGMP